MKTKTKKILIITVLAVLVLASVIMILAYLFDRGEKENKFTVGNNSAEIEEEFNPPPELNEGDNPFVKKVRVKNTGNVPCYIRVFFDFSDSKVKENAKISKDEYIKNADGTDNFEEIEWYPYEQYKNNLPEGWVYISTTDDPVLGGYFYYTEPLDVGESTPYLFKAVNAFFEDVSDITDFEIIITTDSIQVTDKNGEEFPGTDGKGANAYKDAWKEFLTEQ